MADDTKDRQETHEALWNRGPSEVTAVALHNNHVKTCTHCKNVAAFKNGVKLSLMEALKERDKRILQLEAALESQ